MNSESQRTKRGGKAHTRKQSSEVTGLKDFQRAAHRSWARLPEEERREQEDRVACRRCSQPGSLGRTWAGSAVSELRDGNWEPGERMGECRETVLAFFWMEADRVLKRREIPPIGRQRQVTRRICQRKPLIKSLPKHSEAHLI